MPNRILRDGINDSEAVNALSDRAELFYRRLMSFADDFGRSPRNPALLRAKLFSLKLDSWSIEAVENSITECEAVGLLSSYQSEGQKVLQIEKFGQRIREGAKSRFPDPRESAAESGGTPRSAARASATTTSPTTNTTPTKNSEKVAFRKPPQMRSHARCKCWGTGVLGTGESANWCSCEVAQRVFLETDGQIERVFNSG